MTEISPEKITDNAIKLIGRDWMLVTAGDIDSYNTMTASWGGLGFLWNKHVATIYIRPERLTHDFIERHNSFTLSFFTEHYRNILSLLGKKSGREIDKMHINDIAPLQLPSGNITFKQARLTLECRVIYKDTLKADAFVDKIPLEKWYNPNPGGSLHDVYIAEITHAYISE